MSKKTPDSNETKPPTRYWDKRVAAAYLRMMGHTQEEVGASVGRHPDTIGGWEKHETWPLARAEARDRWMADAEDASRQAVLGSIRLGNAELGKWFLERTVDQLAPKQKHEHSGEIDHSGRVEFYIPDNGRSKPRREVLAAMNSAGKANGDGRR